MQSLAKQRSLGIIKRALKDSNFNIVSNFYPQMKANSLDNETLNEIMKLSFEFKVENSLIKFPLISNPNLYLQTFLTVP